MTRLRRVAVTAAVLWSVASLLFVLTNVVCAPFAARRPDASPDLSAWDEPALARAYPGMRRGEVEALLLETWSRRLSFEPYTQFREGAFKGRYVNVHEAGFRVSASQGPWPVDPRAWNVFVFGGSTAFGYGVSDEETFASHLARGLGALLPERRARVYNFGRGAYYSTQERVLFANLLAQGAVPAVALFLDGLNEFFYPLDEPAHSARMRAALEEEEGLLDRLRSAARALPALRLLESRNPPVEGHEPEAEAGGGFAASLERTVRRYAANERLIASAAREHGATAVFAWQPVPMYAYEHRASDGPRPGLGSPERWRRRYERVADAMRGGELGPDFVWCAEVGKGAPGPLYVDRVHYSGAMNRLLAEAVLAALVERHLLPPFVTPAAGPARGGTVAYAVYFLALLAAPLLAGGFLVLRLLDWEPLTSREAVAALALCIGAAGTVLAAGFRLWRRDGRSLGLATLYFTLLTLVSGAGAEAVASFFAPAWPALGLHGMAPGAGARAWGRVAKEEGAVGFNSWGQRDRERERRPRPGTERIAFVGDSLLEESSTVPVSVATERLLARSDVEVVNLGVSATQPDEYYYRTRSIALPLGTRHCVLFLYEGNDLAQGNEITLPSLLGVAAVYPRESVLSLLGLTALNHALTNRSRPVVRIWGRAGELQAEEESLALRVARASDAEMPALLATLVRRADRERVEKRLRRRDLAPFYAMLRQPDQGLFRSYYLSAALKALAAGERHGEVTPAYAYRWVRRTRDLCGARGVRFTLVMVPEAFQVDERMRELWLPLVDMRGLMAPERAASLELAKVCQGDGMDVLDLHGVLAGVPGTYLNPDGHWSASGVEVVARALADHLGRPR